MKHVFLALALLNSLSSWASEKKEVPYEVNVEAIISGHLFDPVLIDPNESIFSLKVKLRRQLPQFEKANEVKILIGQFPVELEGGEEKVGSPGFSREKPVVVYRKFLEPEEVLEVNSLLFNSSENGDYKNVVKALAKGAQVNQKMIFGRTALDAAATNGQVEIVELLLSLGADVNTKDIFGDTPLHCAARVKCRSCVELLLEHKAESGIQNDFQETPLDIAQQKKAQDVVALLENKK